MTSKFNGKSLEGGVWAKEFCKHFPSSDLTLMTTWFSSAILAGTNYALKAVGVATRNSNYEIEDEISIRELKEAYRSEVESEDEDRRNISDPEFLRACEVLLEYYLCQSDFLEWKEDMREKTELAQSLSLRTRATDWMYAQITAHGLTQLSGWKIDPESNPHQVAEQFVGAQTDGYLEELLECNLALKEGQYIPVTFNDGRLSQIPLLDNDMVPDMKVIKELRHDMNLKPTIFVIDGLIDYITRLEDSLKQLTTKEE